MCISGLPGEPTPTRMEGSPDHLEPGQMAAAQDGCFPPPAPGVGVSAPHPLQHQPPSPRAQMWVTPFHQMEGEPQIAEPHLMDPRGKHVTRAKAGGTLGIQGGTLFGTSYQAPGETQDQYGWQATHIGAGETHRPRFGPSEYRTETQRPLPTHLPAAACLEGPGAHG